MPEMDISLTITSIIALCALLSPIITALINNHHHLKMKKLELQEQERVHKLEHQKQIFESYLCAAGACIKFADDPHLREYGSYYALALFYAPEEIKPDMITFNNAMRGFDWDKAQPLLDSLTIRLRELLRSM